LELDGSRPFSGSIARFFCQRNLGSIWNGMTNSPTPEAANLELVSRARAGDLDAFETLTSRYGQRICAPKTENVPVPVRSALNLP
jgi:hypothetical protein